MSTPLAPISVSICTSTGVKQLRSSPSRSPSPPALPDSGEAARYTATPEACRAQIAALSGATSWPGRLSMNAKSTKTAAGSYTASASSTSAWRAYEIGNDSFRVARFSSRKSTTSVFSWPVAS